MLVSVKVWIKALQMSRYHYYFNTLIPLNTSTQKKRFGALFVSLQKENIQ